MIYFSCGDVYDCNRFWCRSFFSCLLGHLFDRLGLLKGALIFIESSHKLIVFSSLFSGGGLNFNIILLGLFVSQYFGTKHYATIYSVCYTVFAFMAALFIYISAVLVDNFGFRQTYIYAAMVLVIGILSFITVITHKKPWIVEPVENNIN